MTADVLFGEPPAPSRLSSGLFTSSRQDWRTPEAIYARFVPPCFDVSDRQDGAFSGLHDIWPEPWFCNPPYDRYLTKWTARMTGNGVALLPARTDTAWFHEHIWGRCRIEFIRGRLRFGGVSTGAPFPSMLCHFGTLTEGHDYR
jgi:site-specific DNA-methyltransferase (adenine-specific)